MSAYSMKDRHGCLTAWLILMIVVNAIYALIFAAGAVVAHEEYPGVSPWILVLLAAISAFGVVCAVALLRWKKWGFWGCCGTGLLVFILNLSGGIGFGKSVYGLVGLGILFILLHTGDRNKAWAQME